MEPMASSNKPPHFVRWAVMLAIIVVLNIFFVVLQTTLLQAPQSSDFCSTNPRPAPIDQKTCVAQNGVWNPAPIPETASTTATPTIPAGYCDQYSKCQAAYTAAEKPYKLHAFELMVAFGVVALVIGVLPLGSSIVSTGLSYGGVLAFIIASIQYWSDAGSWIRLLISTLALVVLIVIGLRRFRD